MSLPEAALAWLRGQPPVQPAQLTELLDQAHEHLQRKFPRAAPAEICAAALAAWAEVEGERTRCHVDLEASTPYLLTLVVPVAGVRRQIPVADLVRLLGPRAAA